MKQTKTTTENAIINRFDEIEFEVLKRSNPNGFGYYSSGLYADRARLLIKEGILQDTIWEKNGWKLTEEGIRYRKEFMEKLRTKHKHKWITDEKGEPDNFAYSIGNHNGYECEKCGYTFCQHCTSEFDVPECKGD